MKGLFIGRFSAVALQYLYYDPFSLMYFSTPKLPKDAPSGVLRLCTKRSNVKRLGSILHITSDRYVHILWKFHIRLVQYFDKLFHISATRIHQILLLVDLTFV